MVEDNNGAGATEFVATNQDGQMAITWIEIYLKSIPAPPFFCFLKNIKKTSGEAYELNQTVGAMAEEQMVLGCGVVGSESERWGHGVGHVLLVHP